MPLTDMRQLTEPARAASQRLLSRAREAKMRTLDLHDVLDGVPGAYLNLDGHWSDKGVQIAAEAVATELRSDRRIAFAAEAAR